MKGIRTKKGVLTRYVLPVLIGLGAGYTAGNISKTDAYFNPTTKQWIVRRKQLFHKPVEYTFDTQERADGHYHTTMGVPDSKKGARRIW